ncbi:MAG TPA: alpha/beta hydrolase-fold protein [Streptosporangiaceae bacterium]|nr:alpha/beta hydrolase-fold protein [Streptosporangiaceae bacterium]
MLEPQSTVLFVLLLVLFVALAVWVALARQPVFRVFAACLAFIPAMLFGVAAVNKYYDYYQTWGALAADLGSQGSSQVASAPMVNDASARQISAILGSKINLKAAAAHGQTIRLTIPGQLSNVRRTVYVYLPPQYFRAGYGRYHFPAIELFPGFPGSPVDWINVVGITAAYSTLLDDGVVKPAVLVMPDTNGGVRTSLQCLNVHHGPHDATYLAVDLPNYLPHLLRVQPPGPAWGVAGYSEGGYCAANLALVYRLQWGAAGILSGYFTPGKDQLGNPPRVVNPFGHSKHAARENTPRLRIAALPVSDPIPQFWLGVGSRDVLGLRDARNFQRLLIARQPLARLDIVPGGGHTMATWRALVPTMLEWMTPLLTDAARHPAEFHQLSKARVAHARHGGQAGVKAAGRRSARAKAAGRHSAGAQATPRA